MRCTAAGLAPAIISRLAVEWRLCRGRHKRQNFLFVGNDRAGENLAGLYSLVATCEANGVNPLAYLADVIIRVHEHPNSRIDELLPHNWRGPPDESASTVAA